MKLISILFFMLPLMALTSNRARAVTSASQSCWPEFTSGHVDYSGIEGPHKFPLYSQNLEGLYVTEVTAKVDLTDEILKVSASYKQGWGLPFVVYAIMAFKDNQPIFYEDFTNNCSSPAINMFPGDEVELMKQKGHSEKIESLKVIIWAR